MKKLFAIILVTLFVLSSVCAFAATYRNDDLTFEYDDALFEVSMDDHTDDEDLVILTGKEAAWGNTFIRIHLRELDDGEQFPTKDEFTPIADVEVTQGDWNGYKNVFMYTLEYDDGTTKSGNYWVGVVFDILYHGKFGDLYPELDTESETWYDDVLAKMKMEKKLKMVKLVSFVMIIHTLEVI